MTLFRSWALTGATMYAERLEGDVLAAAIRQVAGDFQHAADEAGEVGRFALALAGAAEVEQFLGDVLTPQRFLLNHLQVARQHLGVGGADAAGRLVHRSEDLEQPPFQGFRAEEDARQWIVDLVGDAGGEEADRDHPLAADELPASLVDLPGQVGVDRRQPRGHGVELVGQFLQFVAGTEADGMLEVAAVDSVRRRPGAGGSARTSRRGSSREASGRARRPTRSRRRPPTGSGESSCSTGGCRFGCRR